MSAREVTKLDAVHLSRAIKSKQVSCVEVMSAYLDQVDRINPRVNAIVSLQPRDRLLDQAKDRDTQLARGEYLGWMHGFPHAVKDLEPTRGIRTTMGSPLAPADAVAELRNVAGRQLDQEIVERFVAMLEDKAPLSSLAIEEADYETELAFTQRVRKLAQPSRR